jgi:hypothetical protein
MTRAQRRHIHPLSCAAAEKVGFVGILLKNSSAAAGGYAGRKRFGQGLRPVLVRSGSALRVSEGSGRLLRGGTRLWRRWVREGAAGRGAGCA